MNHIPASFPIFPSFVVATGNSHKIEEFAAISQALSFSVHWLSAQAVGGMPQVEETGDTFAANAKIKALALRERLPPDGWVLADDSGLQVDALGGEPGLYSARYAGPGATTEDNNRKLLSALAEIPPGLRTARFVCWLCLANRQGDCIFFPGQCSGTILMEKAGRGGFGYDPLFRPDGYEQTYAELAEGEKHRISHRAKALARLATWWKIRQSASPTLSIADQSR